MSTEEIIRQYRTSPIGRSISAVTRSLVNQQVVVATEAIAGIKGEEHSGGLRLKVGTDNRGFLWAYVYTSMEEFSKALKKGGPFAEMMFGDLFTTIERDSRFGGIFVNSASDCSYPIPRGLFPDVTEILNREKAG